MIERSAEPAATTLVVTVDELLEELPSGVSLLMVAVLLITVAGDVPAFTLTIRINACELTGKLPLVREQVIVPVPPTAVFSTSSSPRPS